MRIRAASERVLWSSVAVLLVLSLVLPLAAFEACEREHRGGGPEVARLVAPEGAHDVPGEQESVSAPLLLLSPAALAGLQTTLPPPDARWVDRADVEHLSGSARRRLPAPPPRLG